MEKRLSGHPQTLLLQSDESWVSAVQSASTQEVRRHKEQSISGVFLGIGDASCNVTKRPVRAANQSGLSPTVPRVVPKSKWGRGRPPASRLWKR